jgi:hypothetical protein
VAENSIIRVQAAKELWMVFNKMKAKCSKVHLTIFNMANSSFQGRMKALDSKP